MSITKSKNNSDNLVSVIPVSYIPTPKKLVKSNTHITTKSRQRDFLQCYVKNYGLVNKTLTELHMGYFTLTRWRKDPSFKANLDIAQQKVNEMMEDSLIQKAITTKSPVPEIFYLRSRDARYSQQVSLQGDTDKPIIITHSPETLKVVIKAITDVLNKG